VVNADGSSPINLTNGSAWDETPAWSPDGARIAFTSSGTPWDYGAYIYAMIEISEFKTREYNPAFVLMQYFGYLRRDPDEGGYFFWLDVLNNRVPGSAAWFARF
jgi:dipeptidyl aminopeptidase/acylaminoacyl peptidase